MDSRFDVPDSSEELLSIAACMISATAWSHAGSAPKAAQDSNPPAAAAAGGGGASAASAGGGGTGAHDGGPAACGGCSVPGGIRAGKTRFFGFFGFCGLFGLTMVFCNLRISTDKKPL